MVNLSFLNADKMTDWRIVYSSVEYLQLKHKLYAAVFQLQKLICDIATTLPIKPVPKEQPFYAVYALP